MCKRIVFGKKMKSAIAAMMMAFLMMGCSSTGSSDAAMEVASVVEEADAEVVFGVEDAGAEEVSIAEEADAEGKDTDTSGEAGSDTASVDASFNKAEPKEAATETTESSINTSNESASSASSQKSSKENEKKDNADSSASASSAAAETAPQEAPQKKDYGRILFVGDSRTVDMFDAGAEMLDALNAGGITVFCRNGGSYGYFASTVDSYGIDNFDTLVTWMGCNDRGNFSEYEGYYNNLLAQGKNVVVCTVGPTADEYLVGEYDQTYYVNSLMVAYNNSLVNWANSNGIKVIDMYSYLSSTADVYLDPADGIHFQPQPTTGVWNYIVSNLQ